MKKERVVLGAIKEGESAVAKIWELVYNKPEGDGWKWNRRNTSWERSVPMEYRHSIPMCACKKHSIGWCSVFKCPSNDTEGGEANE